LIYPRQISIQITLVLAARLVSAFGIISKPVLADDMKIKVIVKALRSLSMDTIVDLVDVIILGFSCKDVGGESYVYDKFFAITPDFSDTKKYVMTFIAFKISSGRLESENK